MIPGCGIRWLAGLATALCLTACGAGDGTTSGRARGAGAGETAASVDVFLAPQLTCVGGPGSTCIGDARFGKNPGALPADAVELAGGRFHACWRDTAGSVECWGDDGQDQLGLPEEEVTERCLGRACRTRSATVERLETRKVLALAAGALHTCALVDDGKVICWGDDRLGQLGRAERGRAPSAVEGLPGPAVAVAAGELHTCAVVQDGGAVYCWGDGSEGQLGPSAQGRTAAPVLVPGLPPVRRVAVGAQHSCALTEAGAVLCWGANRFATLGDGTTTDRATPGPVRGLDGGIVGLAAGDHFTCALDGDGGVQCWGSDQLGQLGGRVPGAVQADAKLLVAAAPVRAELPGPARSLAAAGDHACAVTTTDEVWCWGANELGQLGDGTRTDRPTPVRWAGKSPGPRLATRPEAARGVGLEGLDVSFHSGEIDWNGARSAGRGFGFTLATAGEDFRDPLLPSHWERLREAGLHRGAYHYFVPEDDPQSQAEWFLSQIAVEEGDLPPVVDIETLGADPPPDLADRLRRFLELVEEETGARPIVYTGPTFWNQNLGAGFGEYPLWIAHYDVAEPTVPAGWSAWTLWQWRGDATVEGVGQPVDLDRLAPEVDLHALLVRPRPAGPAAGE